MSAGWVRCSFLASLPPSSKDAESLLRSIPLHSPFAPSFLPSATPPKRDANMCRLIVSRAKARRHFAEILHSSLLLARTRKFRPCSRGTFFLKQNIALQSIPRIGVFGSMAHCERSPRAASFRHFCGLSVRRAVLSSSEIVITLNLGMPSAPTMMMACVAGIVRRGRVAARITPFLAPRK